MKIRLILIVFLIVLITSGCKKEETLFYDCYESNIYYTQDNVFSGQMIYYYKNNLLVKIDCSPNYIWQFTYDNKGNRIKSDYGEGAFYLNEYDSENRCIKSEQYVADTIYLITFSFYSDTLLVKDLLTDKKRDTLNIICYYYNAGNILDSVISNNVKTYHYYSSNSHSVFKYHDNNTLGYKSITTFENGLITRFEEFYYADNGDLNSSHIETKEYDNKKNLTRLITDHSDLYNGTGYYTDYRFYYDPMGKELKIQEFDKNGVLLSYSELTYNGNRLVKIQHFNGNSNKSGYTLVENNCKN